MKDSLSLTFMALADPTRRAMLAQLSQGEAIVTDLAKPFFEKNEFTRNFKALKSPRRCRSNS